MKVAIEVEDLPSRADVGMLRMSRMSPILYGLRFKTSRTYEVRSSSRLGGTFALFDCSDRSGAVCTKVRSGEGERATAGNYPDRSNVKLGRGESCDV
ncbi:MAG: hypothetical protein ACRDLB_06025 [Actinomycetota bacterium]